MAQVGPAQIGAQRTAFVEWSAVIAGALLAAALSLVLLMFGTAIGLSLSSPWPSSGLSAKFVASLAVFYVMSQQIGSFMAGGYVAGRMRARWSEPDGDEAEFRDGLHGGLVWALGIIIGAILLFSTVGGAVRTGASLAAPAAGAAASQGMEVILDTLMRPVLAQPATPGGAAPGPAPMAASQTPADARTEIGRDIAAAVASGGLSAETRVYIAQRIAQLAGISQQDAEKRIDTAMQSARDAADKARRGSLLAALVTGISLIISFGSAWWAAIKGGKHRDTAVPARFVLAIERRTISN